MLGAEYHGNKKARTEREGEASMGHLEGKEEIIHDKVVF